MQFTVDAKAFSGALAILASVAGRRSTVPILACVHLEARDGRLCATTTDLDSRLTIALNADVEAAGTMAIAVHALADAVKAAAKVKGARIDLTAGDDGKATLASGRTRLAFPFLPTDDFPGLEYGDAAETWETPAPGIGAMDVQAEGLDMPAASRKTLAKLAKRGAPDGVAIVNRYEPDGRQWRVRIEAADYDYSTVIDSARLFAAPAKRSRFTYGHAPEAESDALAYLRGLKASLGLPDVAGVPGLADADAVGRLVVDAGRVRGLTIGATMPRYRMNVEQAPDWRPPADCVDGYTAMIDGVSYWNARRNGPGCPDVWLMEYEPAAGFGYAGQPAEYVTGAYSLPLPAGESRVVSAITVEADGVLMPVAADWSGNTSREIGLTAEQVADLCGPVDPSTFVPIEALAFHHGRVIARGAVAERFNDMRERFDRNARKALKNCRTGADKFLTAHNLGIAWRDKVAAFLESLDGAAETVEEAPAVLAPIAGVDGLEIEQDDCDGLEPETEAPAVDLAPVVQFKPAGPGFHVAVIGAHGPDNAPAAVEETPGPFPHAPGACPSNHWNRGDDICEDCGADLNAGEPEPAPVEETAAPDPEPAADYAEPMQPAASSPDLERRLARLEQALGLVEAPKRTPAHAAAIRRAWEYRRRQRFAAKAAAIHDAQRLAQQARADALQGQLNADAKRLERIETGRADEIASLESAIDRARSDLRSVTARLERREAKLARVTVTGRRMVKAAARYRLERNRTRAERDGIAANLQAMTRRAVEADQALTRAGVADQPRRFILSTSLEA